MDNAYYVAAVDQEWRERTVTWGDTECRLYRVMPSFRYVHKGTGFACGMPMHVDLCFLAHARPFPPCVRILEVKVWDDIKTRHAAHGFGFGPDPKSPETAL